MLSPLNEKLKAQESKWTDEDAATMREIWSSLTSAATLNLPDPTSPFTLHTDASGTGISGVLTQNQKLIRLFSAKLSGPELRYSAIEKEALAVVKSMLSFRNLVANSRTYIMTDNRNLTHDSCPMNTRTQRWKLVLSEFKIVLVHKSGLANTAADFLSRTHERGEDTTLLTISENFRKNQNTQLFNCYEQEFSATSLAEKQSSTPNEEIEIYKLRRQDFGSYQLLLDKKDRVYVPSDMRVRLLTLVHIMLMHPGESRLYSTLRKHYRIPNIKKLIHILTSNCLRCQQFKEHHTKYGQIEGHLTEEVSFRKVSSDIFGPIEISEYAGDGKAYVITFVDWYSRTVALSLKQNIRSKVFLEAFQTKWLDRYPKPEILHSDRGTQYTPVKTRLLCEHHRIKQTFSSTFNPSANAISERLNPLIPTAFRMYKGTSA